MKEALETLNRTPLVLNAAEFARASTMLNFCEAGFTDYFGHHTSIHNSVIQLRDVGPKLLTPLHELESYFGDRKAYYGDSPNVSRVQITVKDQTRTRYIEITPNWLWYESFFVDVSKLYIFIFVALTYQRRASWHATRMSPSCYPSFMIDTAME